MPIDQLQGTDLAALHSAIVTTSAAAFPGIHFEFYRADRKNLPFGSGAVGQSPRAYCLLDLPDMEVGDFDSGTQQQAVSARFEAEIVVKSLQADARLLVRTIAGSFAAFLRQQLRWPGALNGPIRVIGCYKDDFSPELDQFEVWRVEWAQEIWLGYGIDVYTIPAGVTDSGNPEIVPGVPAPSTRPNQPLFSYVPLIGVPYEPNYQPLIPV